MDNRPNDPRVYGSLPPRIYYVHYTGNRRFWVLRIPRWAGSFLDWNHKRKFGFIPS